MDSLRCHRTLRIACLLLVLANCLPERLPGQDKGKQIESEIRILVPAYFYPAGKGRKEWEALITAAEKFPITAIVNPASGPGKRLDSNYAAVLEKAKASKLQTIGYVTLSYARKPVSEINAEVDRWLEIHPDIQGIFFDEQPSGREHVAHVGECFAHARKRLPKGVIVSNPGVPCDAGYADRPEKPVLCVFEHHTGWDRFQKPEWLTPDRRDQACILLYDVKSVEAMRARMKQVVDRGAAWVYITDAMGANPWDRLPTYWREELNSLPE